MVGVGSLSAKEIGQFSFNARRVRDDRTGKTVGAGMSAVPPTLPVPRRPTDRQLGPLSGYAA